MDNEDYTQFIFNGETIEDELLFINEDTQGMYAILIDGNAATLELPTSVELVIEETDPSIKVHQRLLVLSLLVFLQVLLSKCLSTSRLATK